MFDWGEVKRPELSELRSILDQMGAETDEGLTVRELEGDLVELLDARLIIQARLVELARSLADGVRAQEPVLGEPRGPDMGERQ